MGELANHPCIIPKPPLAVTVTNWNQLNTLNTTVTEITIPSNNLNDASLTVLDLSRFRRLKKLVVGDECFMNVDEVKMAGLKALESVEIGMNSFTQYKNTYYITADSNRHFYLKECPSLKSLEMGRYSFSDYTVCEIENVDALEVIEIGYLYSDSYNFDSASLELKSIRIHRE